MGASNSILTIRPVTNKDLQPLANLINFEIYVHRHLDWRAPLDWVGYSPYLVAAQDGNLVATLACPPDPPKVAWIRLFAVQSRLPIQRAWDELWPAALAELAQMGGQATVMAIPLQSWFRSLLERSQFESSHDVIVLAWKGREPPPGRLPAGVRIRMMSPDDLPTVAEVDADSFVDVWQNSLECLEVAFRQAAVATIAENEEEMVAYQISTATTIGGHLARLAVRPRVQGMGIGYALLQDLLSRFDNKGVMNVTVNTQHNNLASLALYKKAGFAPTGEVYPVYQFRRDD